MSIVLVHGASGKLPISNMIYLTGDTHGYIDIRKLLKNNVTAQMTEEDYLIICGDFGLVWHYKHETGKERKWLKWLNKQKWTTLFADGNHECFPRLNSYPVKEWHGGKVHEIRPKVLHLMRGEIFELEGKSIFVMGGASSHDRGPAVGDTEKVIGKFWWPEEIPSKEEFDHGLANLKQHDYKVNYIVTHCLPTFLQEFVKQGKYAPDAATEYLENIYHTVDYDHWYCGHYHYDLDADKKVTVLFTRILEAGKNVRDSAMMLGVPKYRRSDTVLFHCNGEERFGTIKETMPWGTLTKHDEPYYNIVLFPEDENRTAVQVRESEIIEKSLIR